jgi:hypothetical protein
MERLLVRNPGDAEVHLRLAYVYEHSCGDDGKAKYHYLQHLVLTLGYPDAATALSALQESISHDSNNCMAHIYIGIILAYRNEFDRALEELRKGTVWRTCESPHYRCNVVPGSTADREITRIIEERERGVSYILSLFDLSHSAAKPIVYYFYESRVHKALLTGDQMPAHALTKKGEVHSVYGVEFKITGLHEDVHVMLRQLGRPPKLLEEGAAMYADCLQGPASFDADEAVRAVPGAVASLISDKAFVESDTYQSYAVAASFVRFLVEAFGVEPFKALYASPAPSIEPEFNRIYGMDLKDLEAVWLERLRKAGHCARDV